MIFLMMIAIVLFFVLLFLFVAGSFFNFKFLCILFLTSIQIALVIIPRPGTVLLPTYAEPAPSLLPIPDYHQIGYFGYVSVFLDQWLMVYDLPVAGKYLILILAFINFVVVLVANFTIINKWRLKSRDKQLDQTLSVFSGPIPISSETTSVFTVL